MFLLSAIKNPRLNFSGAKIYPVCSRNSNSSGPLVHQADILCSRVRKRKIVRERYICRDWDSLHAPMGLISPIVDEKPNLRDLWAMEPASLSCNPSLSLNKGSLVVWASIPMGQAL